MASSIEAARMQVNAEDGFIVRQAGRMSGANGSGCFMLAQ